MRSTRLLVKIHNTWPFYVIQGLWWTLVKYWVKDAIPGLALLQDSTPVTP